MPFSGCHQELRSPSGPHPSWMGLQTRAVCHRPPTTTLMTAADKRHSLFLGEEKTLGMEAPQGSPHLHPCCVLVQGGGGVPQCVPGPWAQGWGVGGPHHTAELPRAALACLGDQGCPLGQLLGSGRGARKRFTDFSSSGRPCAEATVASSSQKDECLFSGGGGLIKSLAFMGTRHILLVAETHGWICFPFFLNALSQGRLSRVKSENGICSPCVYLHTYVLVLLSPLKRVSARGSEDKWLLSLGSRQGLFFFWRKRKKPRESVKSLWCFRGRGEKKHDSFSGVKVFWMCMKQDSCRGCRHQSPDGDASGPPGARDRAYISQDDECARSSHFYINIFKPT